MKKYLTFISICLFSLLLFCACASNTSDISVNDFEMQIINNIPGQGRFDKNEDGTSVTYTRDNVKYAIECSADGYINTLAVTVDGATKEDLQNLNYFKILNPSADRTEAEKASADAVRYSAMALKLLCSLRGDEDCIDAVLAASTGEISENGWALSFDEKSENVIFRAVYVG